MSNWAWVLIVVGGLLNFLAGPILKKTVGDSASQKALFSIKITGLLLVIIGAANIFIAGGKI
ncbi:MAG: hypothetical protein E7402_02845 [Ruminococcaceae bacterium]|nr:hypothetical protein [Oscillospiraceae bacterium]